MTILSNKILPYCLLWFSTMIEGPVTLLVGGGAISSGILQPIPVFLSVVAGNLTGDMGWYSLGRFGRMEWITKLCRKVSIDPLKIEQLREGVKQYAPRLLFLAKLTVGLPIPLLITTGLSRVPIQRWIGPLVVGELIKSAAFIAAGYIYTSTLQQAESSIRVFLWCLTAVFLAAGWIWFKLVKKRA